MVPTRRALLSLALLACTTDDPAALPAAQLAAPCAGCVVQAHPQVDDDGDGYCEDATTCADGSTPGDCNDNQAAAYPGAPELHDNQDQDCDGSIVDGRDQDGDGFSPQDGDCNDQNPFDNPAAGFSCCESGDSDLDGVCDRDDACPGTADSYGGDHDNDGFGVGCDNCPQVPNADQSDADNDGLGDACDPCPGWLGPNQADHDQDGRCDLDPADRCDGPDPLGDADSDGRCDLDTRMVSVPGPSTVVREVLAPTGAYCPGVRRHLIVWSANYARSGQRAEELELWGRVLDAEGNPLTEPARLTWFAENNDRAELTAATVACNTRTNEFVVAARGRNGEIDVYTLRVGSDGVPRGDLHRLPHRSLTNASSEYAPSIAYDPVNDRFLVAYTGSTAVLSDTDIYGRLLNGQGEPLGAAPTRLTWFDAVGDRYLNADAPAVVWNPASERFMVTYVAPADGGSAKEVYLVMADADGAALLPELRLSHMGLDPANTATQAVSPSLAATDDGDLLLAVWRGTDDAAGLPPTKREIYAQRFTRTGALVGGPIRVSHTGFNHDAVAFADTPTVAWDQSSQRFLVAWTAAPRRDGLSEDEREVYGRAVSPQGTLEAHADTRLTYVGADGDASRDAFAARLIPNPLLGGALLLHLANDPVWTGDATDTVWARTWGRTPGQPDSDGDGVVDALDLCAGPDDLDGDGRVGCLSADPLGDCDDNDPALAADNDGDGACDPLDPCPSSATDDADNDGLCDNADRCRGDNGRGDSDGDGTCDDLDPCPLAFTNDADNDGLCDHSDPCFGDNASGDSDGDGTCNNRDTCSGNNRNDADGDGVPNACDPCPQDPINDADGDLVCDGVDPCWGSNASGDSDGDGLCDAQDACPLSHVDDLDGDGTCDDLDLCVGDDLSGDSDGDGLCDNLDRCTGDHAAGDPDGDGLCGLADPCFGFVVNDFDGDGTCDDVDLCSGDDLTGDADGDRICDDSDRCAGAANTLDADNDRVCDDIDPCFGRNVTGDSDGDGTCENLDLCRGDDATGDSDGDGDCNDLDRCPGPGTDPDLDNDGRCGDRDLCPLLPEPANGDFDDDGFGDACDPCPTQFHTADDLDSDGLPDACDPCPLSSGSGQLDLDLDGLCDLDPSDTCRGLDALGDADGDGLCDLEATLISKAGSARAPSASAANPSLAFSLTSRRALAVWDEADTNVNLWTRVLDGAHLPITEARPLTLWSTANGFGREAADPSVAWNSSDDTFLIAYRDGSYGDTELWTRRIGLDGAPIGEAQQVTTTGGASDRERSARAPALVYNHDRDEFLLVHVATERVYNVIVGFDHEDIYYNHYPKEEIYTLRLNSAGAPITGEQARLTTTPGAPPYLYDATNPAALWDSARQRYVVVHQADRHTDGLEDLFVSRLDALGAPIGDVAMVNPSRSNETYDATLPKLALSETEGVFLVVWRAELTDTVRSKAEVFGRLLDRDARPFGAAFRISHTGRDWEVAADVSEADVVWDEAEAAFVVAWSAQPGTGGLTARKREVFRQLVRADGTLALPNDERLTFMLDSSPQRDTASLALAYNPWLGTSALTFLSDDPLLGAADDKQGLWSLLPTLAPGLDSDGDGVRDELDLCVGPDDSDGDGWLACAISPGLRDCDDLDPTRARDNDQDGLCDADDPCPLDPGNDADNDGACANADLCLGEDSTGDTDGDELCDDLDPCPTADDADGDGLCDDVELCFGEDSSGDSDGDGFCDAQDLCPGDNRLDTDGDGTPDGCDPCPLDPGDDLDGDGLCDSLDLCFGDDLFGDNDLNGVCDDLDPCLGDEARGDDDLDGVCNDLDLCAGDQGTGDTDGDHVCDDRDLCVGPGIAPDTDSDGVCDDLDLCLAWPDSATRDSNGDGVGDHCDTCPFLDDPDLSDSDGDGLGDPCDACPGSAHLRQGDLDLDGVCDVDPADLCFGPAALGDADGDGLCDADELQVGMPDVSVGSQPAMAFSPTSRTHLLVWVASRDTRNQPTGASELWGRALDPLGRPVGPPIWLTRTDRAPSKSVSAPAIAWNKDDDTFLVAYANDEHEEPQIEVVLVDAAARPLGSPILVPTAGDHLEQNTRHPAVLYNTVRQIFELYYESPGAVHFEPDLELRRRELDRTGQPLGAADELVADFGGELDEPAIAWSGRRGTSLLVFEGPHNAADEIFGELRDAHGVTLLSQISISQKANLPDTDEAHNPSVAYSEPSDRYLVAWEGEDAANWGNVSQIHAALVDGSGRAIGLPFLLTSSEGGTPNLYDSYDPKVVWDSAHDAFLVYLRARALDAADVRQPSELFAVRVSMDGAVQPPEQLTTFGYNPAVYDIDGLSAAYSPLIGQSLLAFTGAPPTSPNRRALMLTRHHNGPDLDTDNDGVIDPLDRCLGPDDLDGDGFVGCLDDCDDTDPTTAADLDDDGLCDHLDPCFGDQSTGDNDNDGVCDDRDACPGDDHHDSDHDGLPDACDPCPTELGDDGDPTCAAFDLCAGDDRTGDRDNDGTCDDRDPCPRNNPDDVDLDGICTNLDLCYGDNSAGDNDGDRLCDHLDTCFGTESTGDNDNDGTCDDRDLCYGDQSFGDADNDGYCEAPLDTLDAFVPGAPFRLRLRNAPRGAQAFLLLSTTAAPGPRVCHPAANNACTRLQNRVVIGQVTVDTSGEARWAINVPATVPSGATASFQAVWVEAASGRGDSSNVLQRTSP